MLVALLSLVSARFVATSIFGIGVLSSSTAQPTKPAILRDFSAMGPTDNWGVVVAPVKELPTNAIATTGGWAPINTTVGYHPLELVGVHTAIMEYALYLGQDEVIAVGAVSVTQDDGENSATATFNGCILQGSDKYGVLEYGSHIVYVCVLGSSDCVATKC